MGHSAWHSLIFKQQLPDGYFGKINYFLNQVYSSGTIYPPRESFWVIQTTDLDVKVVILGQDPYHGPGQAQGLRAFLIPDDIPAPGLLFKIF